MILGDFNAYLLHGYRDKNPVKSNERGRVLEQFLDERRLMSVSSQMDAIGPGYSYVAHSGKQTSLIYHVVISEDTPDLVKETGNLKIITSTAPITFRLS